jgi:sugar lactone lactonase YvrE
LAPAPVIAVAPAPTRAAQVITTIAGTGEEALNLAEGDAAEVHIGQPFGVEVGPDGGLYIAEVSNHRVLRLDLRAGRVRVVGGTGKRGGGGNGGPALEASLDEPYEVRFGAGSGTGAGSDMYIVEMAGAVVRRVDARTGRLHPVAGSGKAGFAGDGGPAVKAALRSPHSIALDGRGALYIADIGNHRVRRVDLRAGAIDTIAGNGEATLPRDGAAARGGPLLAPRALAVRGTSLWIALREGHSIWKLDLESGRLEHAAGSGRPGYGDGPAKEAAFNGPKGIAWGPRGDLFIADTENHAIRRLDPDSGLVSTVAGSGPEGRGFGGDGGPPSRARLDRPHGVAVDGEGTLYIGDSENHRVRRVAP